MKQRKFEEKDKYEKHKITKMKDGRFRGSICDGFGNNNKRHYRSFYAKDRTSVAMQMAEWIDSQIKGESEKRQKASLFKTELNNFVKSKFGKIKNTSYDRLEETLI